MSAPEAVRQSGASIARVAVDIPLPHLDRYFDYSIPEAMADQLTPGVRVRVRFAGKVRDGFVVEVANHSDVVAKLAPISKLVSAEQVLSSAQVRLIRAVADHYAGSFADVLRLAVPPRHATTEKANQRSWPKPVIEMMPTAGMYITADGEHYLTALANGEPIRAHWQVPPRFNIDEHGIDDWTRGFVQAAVATLRAGRGVIFVVPDFRDLARLRDRLAVVIGAGSIAELHADLGPAARYRNYLAISRGEAKVVVGTRAAVYAPVHDLGLIGVWDDGDDLHSEQRAPYPHSRDVAALRAGLEKTGLLFGSYARTCEVQAWVERGWCGSIAASAAELRRISPVIRAAVDSQYVLDRDPRAEFERLPRPVFDTIRRGLASGPVLVQVPRAGYLPVVVCAKCHTPVRCASCNGPVRLTRNQGARRLDCAWCGRIIADWKCGTCGHRELRAPVVGTGRTVEELGKAFPGVRVIESSGEKVVSEIGTTPALVVATPGAEPMPADGYSAAVLLDATRLLDRPSLRASEEALRRWFAVTALVRPADKDGTVMIVGPATARPVQSLVRLDPGANAAGELAERRSAGFPPAMRFVTITGGRQSVQEFTELLPADQPGELLGPVELDGPLAVGQIEPYWQLTMRCLPAHGAEMIKAVRSAVAGRSARKMAGGLRVKVDPAEL